MARWLAARARNALRRPLRIIGVTVTAFLIALLALILMPRQDAPPIALLGAALVLGMSAGFAVTMAVELRDPRVADGLEGARVARARLLGVIEPPPQIPDRTRRTTDAPSSPLLDLNSPAYRFLYLQVAATRPASGEPPLVFFTGEEGEVVAAIAANVAIAAAYDSRSVVLIDADRRAATASQLLGVRQATNIVATSIVPTTVGRDRSIDVIPQMHEDALRLARRYDVVIVSVPEGSPELAAPVGAPDVVICARIAHTSLTRLRRSADALREREFHVRGVVLWNI